MATELRVNGKTYNLFKSVSGVYSKDTFAGEVAIVVTQPPNNNSFIKQGDLIEIFLDTIQRFTGYIEKLEDSIDHGSHDVSFRARDKVSDLIDSSVPQNVKSLENVTLYSDLVKLCIDGLGLSNSIKVIDNVNAVFSKTNSLIGASVGQKVGEYLQDNARVVQVFLNTDGLGNVVINRGAGELKTKLLLIPNNRSNNIKSSSLNIDNSQRFNKYTVYSNSSLATESSSVNDLNNIGEAFDDEIRPSRIFEKLADNPMSSEQCIKAADEEANIRRARSFNYNCEVAGFSANGELWNPNNLVFCRDTEKGLNGKFLINEVTWGSGKDSGEVVTISLTLPDKGTVQANPSVVNERTTQPSKTYKVQTGDTLSQIALDNGITTKDLVSSNPSLLNRDLIFTGQNIIIPITGGIV